MTPENIKKEADPICDIVIPIWNQPDLTRRCLQSLEKSTEVPIRLILIDNGSQAPTRELLNRFERTSRFPVRILRNDVNLGFIKATNQGIQAAQTDWICLLNNDTVVTSGWLTQMLKVADSDPKIALVNPSSNSLGSEPGKTPLAEYAAILKNQSGKWTELATALGFCLLAKRSLYDKIGLLDETFGMGNFDDDDLSSRVKAQGYRCVRACAAYVWHEEKASFRQLPGWEKAFAENRKQFENRWGRRLRILWAAPNGSVARSALLELLHQGHQITFVDPEAQLPPEITSHSQAKFLKVPRGAWRAKATARLLFKRKKPFDLVISHDPAWSRWLNRLRWLYPARRIDSPETETILSRCRELAGAQS